MQNKILWTIGSLGIFILTGSSLLAGQGNGQRQGQPTKSVLEQRLKSSARPAQFVRIYGSGLLWKKTIGLDETHGVEIRDRKSIASLLQTLRGSGHAKYWDLSFEGGIIAISFMSTKPDDMYDYSGDVNYIRRKKAAYCLYRAGNDPTDTMAELRPGSGLRFEAFLRQMVKRARSHDRTVCFFEVQGD